jgi:hypothetical protein
VRILGEAVPSFVRPQYPWWFVFLGPGATPELEGIELTSGAGLQSSPPAETIADMVTAPASHSASGSANPFQPGTMVVVTLANPREKFWGAILSLSAEGLSLRGIELASFEDLVVMIKEGEPFSLGVVFFPMHRVDRMELDLPDGSIPSLSQRFTSKTGLDPVTMLAATPRPNAVPERT